LGGPDGRRFSSGEYATNFAGALGNSQSKYFSEHGKFASDPNQLEFDRRPKEFKYSNGYNEFSKNLGDYYTVAGEIKILAHFEDNSTHNNNAERPISGIIMLLYWNEYWGGYRVSTNVRLITVFYVEGGYKRVRMYRPDSSRYSRHWHEDIPIIGSFFNIKKKEKQSELEFLDAYYRSQMNKIDISKGSTVDDFFPCPPSFVEIK
jgi:hypothetical protein